VHHLTDPAAVRAILEQDRPWAVYALGDLAPEHAPYAEWRASADHSALLLLYRRFGPTVLFTLGPPDAVRNLLSGVGERELYLLVRPEILPVLQERYVVSPELAMWRMTIAPEDFHPAPVDGVTRLGPADILALESLFADGQPDGEAPDFFFPALVAEGVYYGVWEGSDLITAAGTHLMSPELGVGAVGNVYTRRDRRGRGLAKQVTSAVTAALIRLGLSTIALNVKQANAAAQRVYEQLGFRRYCAFYEGIATKR
jgi:ribosomal protein S18 acetylase RimI-like enzyme